MFLSANVCNCVFAVLGITSGLSAFIARCYVPSTGALNTPSLIHCGYCMPHLINHYKILCVSHRAYVMALCVILGIDVDYSTTKQPYSQGLRFSQRYRMSRDGAVCTVPRLRTGYFTGQGKGFFSFPKPPRRFWGPLSHPFDENREFLP
jgi:hypothetical protein